MPFQIRKTKFGCGVYNKLSNRWHSKDISCDKAKRQYRILMGWMRHKEY